MKTVYLGLGSNVGNREDSLQRAITALNGPDLRISRVSSVYETAPRDVVNQPLFLNLVVEAQTGLFPVRLLLRVLNIERRLGRKRTVVKGPRTIDIDILLFGSFVVDARQLVIPHPRLAERRFVLEPMCDLAPDLKHPVLMRSMRELLAATKDQQARKVSWQPVIPVR